MDLKYQQTAFFINLAPTVLTCSCQISIRGFSLVMDHFLQFPSEILGWNENFFQGFAVWSHSEINVVVFKHPVN